MIDEELFKEIAQSIEADWEMGGLSNGLYYDYALEIAKEYIQRSKYERDQVSSV